MLFFPRALQTTGDGNSKKVAKKHAAENMLNELKKLPPLRVAGESQANGRRKNFPAKRTASTNSRQQVQQIPARRKGGQTIKEVNTSALSTETATDENELSNPISMLLRIQQAAKQSEPVYAMVEERGQGRRKEFIMEVSCTGLTARGVGGSKKLAKREAAKNILVQMGYGDCGDADLATANAIDKTRKVTFSETKVYNENNGQSGRASSGRQLVPGILLMKSPENSRSKWPFYGLCFAYFFSFGLILECHSKLFKICNLSVSRSQKSKSFRNQLYNNCNHCQRTTWCRNITNSWSDY